ncbi:N-acetyltransferase [Flaviflexus salsibiostraticola]|uniref:N-acetyltransferase n=2 Tax=Flaviflexus salsibiostraticola TaxID=1282737 RepID=A0A3S8Z817_9ACTO|nr:N-acetyltransferase [Flaviflexus salsibiostraticola]
MERLRSPNLRRMTHLRLVTDADAEELTRLLVTSREFLAPFEPRREDSHFELEFQRQVITAKLAAYESGSGVPFVIVEGGTIVGQLSLDRIEFGPYRSAEIGYWVAEHATGRGLATNSVAEALDVAESELGLSRIVAATLPDNEPSMKVLRRSGFVEFGRARSYMEIAGERRDHLMFERILAEAVTGRDGEPDILR